MSRSSSRSLVGVAALVVALLVAGCSLGDSEKGANTAYSGAFAFWLYGSDRVAVDMASLAERLRAGDGVGYRTQLGDAVARQVELNRGLRAASPPRRWREKHVRVTGALEEFDTALTQAASGEATLATAERLEPSQRSLIGRVVACYAEGSSCDGPAR